MDDLLENLMAASNNDRGMKINSILLGNIAIAVRKTP